jgi:hypothetical protein
MSEISDEAYEELRLILEKHYEQTFTLEEAKEIGDGLVDFYDLLIELTNHDGTER